MQIKNINPKNLQKPRIIGVIKLVLFVACVYFIFDKLQSQSIEIAEIQLPDGFGYTLGFVSILMFINWFLEALRWKVSLQQFEAISMKEAWQVILVGLALNWALPFTTGDLIARISRQQDKFQATAAAMLNRGIMLILTLLLGLYGMSYLAQKYDWNGWFVIALLIGIPIMRRLFKNPINHFLKYFKELSGKMLFRLISLSFLRYTVFVFQFYLLLNSFIPEHATNLIIAGIGWIFLVRSVLPLFFGGVGVREASGIFFFQPYVSQIELVIVPIFLIWFINTVIPSIVGLMFLVKHKPLYAN